MGEPLSTASFLKQVIAGAGESARSSASIASGQECINSKGYRQLLGGATNKAWR